MKRLLFWLLIGGAAVLAPSSDPLAPGGTLNPWLVSPAPSGEGYEVRPEYYSPDPLKPGGYLNPVIIEPREDGGYAVHPQYSFGNGEDDD